MWCIGTNRKWLIEEGFLALPVGNAVLFPVLADVSIIPVKAFTFQEQIKQRHSAMYIGQVYAQSSRFCVDELGPGPCPPEWSS